MRSFYLALALLALPSQQLMAQKNKVYGQEYIEAIADNTRLYVSKRPDVKDRLFRSEVIDKKIEEVKKLLKGNRYLAWMFENCFPNTLETTVHYRKLNGEDDTFVYTGDIPAMWLRDSGAQVWPYVQFAVLFLDNCAKLTSTLTPMRLTMDQLAKAMLPTKQTCSQRCLNANTK